MVNIKVLLIIYFITEAEQVPTGDGMYKMAMLINKQLPGPPIVVYEDQEVNLETISYLVFIIQCKVLSFKY